MNRLLTLASTSLFAAGLAILPVSVYAQPNATVASPTGTDMKSGTPVTTSPAAMAPVAKTPAAHTPKDAVATSGTTTATPGHDAKDASNGKDKVTTKVVPPAGDNKVTHTPASGPTSGTGAGAPAKVGG